MKSWCILFLAIFASCEANTKVERIEEETRSKLTSNPPVRSAFSSRVNLQTINTSCDFKELRCKDEVLSFCYDKKIMQVKCSQALNSVRGYCNCDGNDCQLTPPTNCARPPPQSTCNNDGVKTPNPSDCKLFSYCDGTQLLHFRCVDNLVYDPIEGECTTGVCRSVRCPTSQTAKPVYVPFPQDDSWYMLCFRGDYTVGKCDDGFFVANQLGCSSRCKKAGYFPDPKPDRQIAGYYYSCSGIPPNFKLTQLKCATDGYQFDENAKICKPPTTKPPPTTTGQQPSPTDKA